MLNYALDNGLLFWGLGACILGTMTWSFVREVFFNSNSDNSTIVSPTTDSGVSTIMDVGRGTNIPSPILHDLLPYQSRETNETINSIDITTVSNTSSTLYSDVGTQTGPELWLRTDNLNVNLDSLLSLNNNASMQTGTLNSSILETISEYSYFGNKYSQPWLYPDHSMSLTYQIIDNSLSSIVSNPTWLTHADLINLLI